MRKALKQLKGRLGRVVRDIERKMVDWPTLPDSLVHELTLAKRLLVQQPKGSNKLYSLHASEVECISKGKVWFARLWDITTMPKTAGNHRFGFIARTDLLT